MKIKYQRHGLCGSPEHTVWQSMLNRCYTKSNPRYHRYGGRGISVCDRWRHGCEGKAGVSCFLEDMGKRPSNNHTIDRIDVDGNYSPENCRWSTPHEQSRNTSRTNLVSLDDERLCLTDALPKLGLSPSTYYQRIKRGESPEKALRAPRGPKNNSKYTREAEYLVYRGMLNRCLLITSGDFERYGNRGILPHPKWVFGDGNLSGYKKFLVDMGNRPSKNHTLERIDNSGGYSKDNCRWALPSDQARNRRSNNMVVVRGVSMCITDAVKNYTSLDRGTVRSRMKRGWTVEDALFTPAYSAVRNPDCGGRE